MGVGSEAQLHDFAGGVASDELTRWALRHDGAMIHHDEAIAQLFGLVHVVSGDDQRDALTLQPVEPFPEQVSRLGVESGRGLVEDQDLWSIDESPRDRQAALHATGQVVNLVVRPLGELRELQELRRALAKYLTGDIEVAAEHLQVQSNGELQLERVLLGHHAEAAADLGAVRARIEAQDREGARTRLGDGRDHPHGTGLARTVGAEETEALATLDGEADSLDRCQVAE